MPAKKETIALLKDFQKQRRFHDLSKPSQETMAEDAVETWKLLWRGIASLIVYDEHQSDPVTSWKLINDQLKMLEVAGINVTVQVGIIRNGNFNAESVLQSSSVSAQSSKVTRAIVHTLLSLIESSKGNPDVDPNRVRQIDGMMLLRNLLNNKWHRKQEAARDAFFRKYHSDYLSQNGYVSNPDEARPEYHSGSVLGDPLHHRYFPPL
eukprot:g1643.t1